jgi:hypothetical protein
MLKARIARKKRALRAASVQKACKARKACNADGGLSEVAEVCPKLNNDSLAGSYSKLLLVN